MPKPDSLKAFHGPVEFIHWEYTSNQGTRIKLGLESRDELAYFDKVTRRNRNRAGQRFQVFWQTEDGEVLDGYPTEVWFCLASWSHTQGASIVLSIHPDELDLVDGLTTRDQPDEKTGHRCYLALVEIADDDHPVNQEKRDLIDSLPSESTPSRPKGGPISRNAGILCGDPDFQAFVQWVTAVEPDAVDPDFCAAWIRGQCQIESRAELDHDDLAKNRYETLVKRRFLRWGEQKSRRAHQR